jgi:hypothetical protein
VLAWQRILLITRSLRINPKTNPSFDRIILTFTHRHYNLTALKIFKRNIQILYSDPTTGFTFLKPI